MLIAGASNNWIKLVFTNNFLHDSVFYYIVYVIIVFVIYICLAFQALNFVQKIYGYYWILLNLY